MIMMSTIVRDFESSECVVPTIKAVKEEDKPDWWKKMEMKQAAYGAGRKRKLPTV